jgi:uncharacterized membrane protein HdeD (DUF308 family)
LLGVVLLAAGLFALLHVVTASVVSVILFSATLVVVGGFQIVHAFFSQHWRGFAFSLVVGVLLLLGGLLLLTNPLAASLGLTLGFSVVLIAAGVVRLVLAYREWRDYGWMLLLSGLLSTATGVFILLGFPWSGLIVPGLLLAIDFILHGAWWLSVGLWVRRPREPMDLPRGGPSYAA